MYPVSGHGLLCMLLNYQTYDDDCVYAQRLLALVCQVAAGNIDS